MSTRAPSTPQGGEATAPGHDAASSLPRDESAASVGQPGSLRHRTDLEQRVREVLATQAAADAQREGQLSLGDRAADRVARWAGSWAFLFAFLGTIALWIGLNTVAWSRHWDIYPFILLNFVISVLTAVQAPLIMMSQNRDQDRDRQHSEAEFRTSVRAEILLEHLTAEIEEVKLVLGDRSTP